MIADFLLKQAAFDPLDVDVSDQGDEWVEGFLAGQVNALEYLNRHVVIPEGEAILDGQ